MLDLTINSDERFMAGLDDTKYQDVFPPFPSTNDLGRVGDNNGALLVLASKARSHTVGKHTDKWILTFFTCALPMLMRPC